MRICAVCQDLGFLFLASRRESTRRTSWFLSRVELSMSLACPRFPHCTVPPSVRPRPRRGHVVEATATVGLSRTPGSGVQQRGRAESGEREAVIRVAAKSKFKSNPYLHLSPCRRQIPPCFHIQVRCFNPETDAHCGRVSPS